MPLIVTRIPRTRQPQRIAGLHPALRSGAGDVLWNIATGSDEASRRRVVAPSALNPDVSSLGRVLALPNSSSTPTVNLVGGLQSSSWTVAFAGRLYLNASPGYNTFLATQDGGYRLKFSHLLIGSAVFGIVVPGVAIYSSSIASIDGHEYVVVYMGTNGGTFDIAVQDLTAGVLSVQTGISLGTPVTQSGASYVLSEETSGFGAWTGSTVAAVALLQRRLPLAEGAALAIDFNRRAFAPIERRIWVPSASSAVPSITAVYADSVTASSVVPRVTLDFA